MLGPQQAAYSYLVLQGHRLMAFLGKLKWEATYHEALKLAIRQRFSGTASAILPVAYQAHVVRPAAISQPMPRGSATQKCSTAMAEGRVPLETHQHHVAFKFGGKPFQQRRLPAQVTIEVAEEAVVVAVFAQAMTNGFGRAQTFFMAIGYAGLGEGGAEGSLGKALAARGRQLAHIQQQINLRLFERTNEGVQRDAFVADGKEFSHPAPSLPAPTQNTSRGWTARCYNAPGRDRPESAALRRQ